MNTRNGLHTFTIYSWEAGSARVRVREWADHLNVDIVGHNYAGLGTVAARALAHNPRAAFRAEQDIRSFDPRGKGVIVSREVSPFSRGGSEERVLRYASRGVYDFDDALFADTGLRRRWTGGSDKIARAIRAADVVIAGNDYLAEWAERFNSHVRVIPSCVDPLAYVRSRGSTAGEPARLVWLGSASTEQFLVPLVPHLRRVHEATGAVLRVISSVRGNPALDALGPSMERVPWTLSTFASSLVGCDVALAPLLDTPFARGKCAYKVLQYGAAGLSIVGSPIGANRTALDRLGGIGVEADEDWSDAIIQALTEPKEAREGRGDRAIDGVTTHYSFQTWADSWCQAVGIRP